MLIQLLIVVLIIGLLYAGPTIENTWTAVVVYGGAVIGIILAFRFSSRLTGGITGFLMGTPGGGKSEETYSVAEKYVAEHNYEAAKRLYLDAIKRNRKSPVPRLKLADVYRELGEDDNCIKYLEEALSLRRGLSEHQCCTTLNRIADIYLQNKNDSASAVATLERLIEEFPSSKFAAYARERITGIEKVG